LHFFWRKNVFFVSAGEWILIPKVPAMNKKYIITLSEIERQDLNSLLENKHLAKQKARNIRVLLGSDQGPGGKRMTDEEIAKAYDLTTRTIRNVRKNCLENSLEFAIGRKKRRVNPSQIKVVPEIEDNLVELSQKVPPEGFASWSLRLLADQMVELDYVDSISHEKVRQVLKKTA
jgi:hypothetical protein